MIATIFTAIKTNLPKLLEINNIVFIVAIGVAVSLIGNTIIAIEKNFELQTKVDKLSEETAILDLENENLKLNNLYFKTDDYLEIAARDTLGLVASGEKVIVLPDYSHLKQQAKTIEEKQSEPVDISNTDQWLYFLFRREP